MNCEPDSEINIHCKENGITAKDADTSQDTIEENNFNKENSEVVKKVQEEVNSDEVSSTTNISKENGVENSESPNSETKADGDPENSSDNVAVNSSDNVAENSASDNVAETSSDNVAETSSDNVAETSSNNVAKVEQMEDEDEEIVELPVIKEPAPLVDLIEDDDDGEAADKDEKPGAIKLKSFAALGAKSDGFAIGDIVEHGEYVGADESGEMHLKISNVVGGEDSITGLLAEEDGLSPIQITSISTLIEPISPKSPGSEDKKTLDLKEEENSTASEGDSEETKSKKDSLRAIRITSVVSEGKTDGSTKDKEDYVSVHILRNNLIIPRNCTSCFKNVQCEFRASMTRKGEANATPSRAYLCSESCKLKWQKNMPSDYVIEKPRIFFERLCGMCSRELSGISKDKIYVWETREFCNKLCLADHISEVANTCHYCGNGVQVLHMAKYCVRFGSDVYQFCSNMCLVAHKSAIQVCCFCQKSLSNVEKVVSPLNKSYCSQKCMKRSQRRDINQPGYTEKSQCTVCRNTKLNMYEAIINKEVNLLCSDPCLNSFKFATKVKAVNCCVCTRVLSAEDVSQFLYHNGVQLRVFCTDSCLNVYVLSIRKIVSCQYCQVKKYNFDMICNTSDATPPVETYYCSVSCLGIGNKKNKENQSTGTSMADTNGVTSSDSNSSDKTKKGPPSNIIKCNMCHSKAPALFHMVMSDNSLRNFCTYACATKFKHSFGFQVSLTGGLPPSSNRTPLASLETNNRASPTPSQKDKRVSKSVETSQRNGTTNQDTAANTGKDETSGLPEMIAAILKTFKSPVAVANKSTMCKPKMIRKDNEEGSTEKEDPGDPRSDYVNTMDKRLIPVPIPIYVPTPMMMYNIPCPVPLVMPLPIPVPVFIPTTSQTTEDIFESMEHMKQDYKAGKYNDASFENTFEDEIEILLTLDDLLPQHEIKIAEKEEVISELSENEKETPMDTEDKTQGKRTLTTDNGECDEAPPSKKLKSDSLEEGYRDSSSSSTTKKGRLNARYWQSEMSTYSTIAWKHWVRRKTEEEGGNEDSSEVGKCWTEDLDAMNEEVLNNALCMFLNDIKKPDEQPYQPDTIYYLLLGIQQYLLEKSKNTCIFLEVGFEGFTSLLDKIIKVFTDKLSSASLNSMVSEPKTRITEEMLWECKQLGAHTPHVLLNTLFYFNTKIFKLRTVEEHAAMSFVQIIKQWRRTSLGKEGCITRSSFLKYYPKKAIRDETKDGDKRAFEMHENKDDPLRCPVKLYEFYLSKCPEEVRTQRNTYYVYPEGTCLPNSTVWYSNEPLHLPFLQQMFNRVLLVKEIIEALHS